MHTEYFIILCSLFSILYSFSKINDFTFKAFFVRKYL